VHAGGFAATPALVEEAAAITEATGSPRLMYTSPPGWARRPWRWS
jgi:hypothetical protein